jgi:bacterioferritin-associated ferredoxin
MDRQSEIQNPKSGKPVTRCVCFDKTFAELKEAGVETLEEIQERFGCSTKCGLCRPYLLKMLETGETEFDVMGT